MKWGVRRARRKVEKNERLRKKALELDGKSDKAAKKAAKVRMKIANNERYVAAMKRKVSSIPEEELRTTYAFVNDLFKD